MPELPEVEVLVRHLAPALRGKTIQRVIVHRPKVLGTTKPRTLLRVLKHARFLDVRRRGKYLVFTVQPHRSRKTVAFLGHLGMTGRMYLQRKTAPLPKHAPVVLDLSDGRFVFEDTRYFGKFTLDTSVLEELGPEPLSEDFTSSVLLEALKRSTQSVKVKLLDQTLVAGVGNIYASEALFRAGISPNISARELRFGQVERIWKAVRDVLTEAISFGSTVALNHGGGEVSRDRLFYFGSAPQVSGSYEERLRVYDRLDQPCYQCGNPIRRIVQAARSTFYCAKCQK